MEKAKKQKIEAILLAIKLLKGGEFSTMSRDVNMRVSHPHWNKL